MGNRPTTQRGVAAYDRLLEVATAEFAAHGIAGARTERIVVEAESSRAQLYAYFGNKELLFDAVFAEALAAFTADVAVRDDDLADWAVRLYDEYLRRPHIIRLVTWARLERTPWGPIAAPTRDGRVELPKLDAVTRAQARGRARAGHADDIFAMVIAMSMAWSPVSNVYAAHPDEPQADHNRRRNLLRAMVQAATAP